eukprot:GHVU01143013.1.p1 GENE.GHVU01143013.1~~GHVU01143013.1.p1  ORF type:complete len:211 (+),score=13.18 GHVU01143013.1:37-669(+)
MNEFRSMSPHRWLKLIFLLLGIVFHDSFGVEGINFTIALTPGQKRCVGEILTKDVLFVAELTAKSPFHAMVHDERQVIYEERDSAQVRTAFTTRTNGAHTVCVENYGEPGDLPVALNLKWGPEAKDYSQIAKKEHLDPVVSRLRHMDDELSLYHSNLMYMRGRESRRRETTDSTSFRVIVFCMIILAVFVVSTLAQTFYFRAFFKAKKLI